MSEASAVQGESKAQEAARLRRERRNAKIQAGGSERLSKITSLSGRPVAAEAELSKSSPAQAQSASRRKPPQPSASDPEEVDISTMFQNPPPSNMNPQSQDDFLRQLLSNAGPPPHAGGPNQPPSLENDPMMQMMQQLMGGGGPNGPGDAGNGGFPAGLASMFSGAEAQPEPQNRQTYLWRIVHALFAFLLAGYAVLTLQLTSSSLARTTAQAIGDGGVPRLFWIFTTAELVLQSSRYFIDKGQLPVSGIMGGLGRILPEPYAGYVRVLSRYAVIYTTIVSDAMVIIFVMGVAAWWQGLAVR